MPQAAMMLHPSAAAPSVPQLSTPSPRVQASSPFFKPDPDGEGQSGTLHGSACCTCLGLQSLHLCLLLSSGAQGVGCMAWSAIATCGIFYAQGVV